MKKQRSDTLKTLLRLLEAASDVFGVKRMLRGILSYLQRIADPETYDYRYHA